MTTAHHAPSAANAPDPDAGNNISVRQLLDGNEYPVAKGDIIKKRFDRKADVEQCAAYLHVL